MKKDWKYFTERILAIVAAIILLQTLYFKFSAHPSSVALFTELGIEPWGRIGTGVLELIAGVLLLFRSVSFHGALLSLGLMAGALFSHLTVLGIEYQGDSSLFAMALFVFIASMIILMLRRKDIEEFIKEAKAAK
jgi:hypothetical protein